MNILFSVSVMVVCVYVCEFVVAHLFPGSEPLVLHRRFAHSVAAETQVVATY